MGTSCLFKNDIKKFSYSSGWNFSLNKAKEILQKHRIEKLLVVDNKQNLTGLITVKDIQKNEDYPNACKDKNGRLRVGAAIGVSSDFIDRAKALSNVDVDVVVIDTAHGHSKSVIKSIKLLKKKFHNFLLLLVMWQPVMELKH